MAGDAKILKEYLLSLGFNIDETQVKKFDLAILRHRLGVGGLAKGLLGAAAAVQAMVAVYARSMEKLYYSSRRAESSAGSIQALQFAARAVGVDGAAMVQSLEGMARAMRLNPGLQGLLETLGIPVRGRDKADVMVDMLKALKAMPFEIGAQYAQMFGLDPDSFLLLTQQLDLLEKQRDLRKSMAAEAGLDMDAAAQAGKEYANVMRDITEQLGILKDSALIAVLPYFKSFAEVLRQVVFDWARLLNSPTTRGGFTGAMSDLWEAIKLRAKGTLDRDVVTPTRALASTTSGGVNSRIAGGRVTQEMVGGGATTTFAALEALYGLPAGLLDKVWAKESARGKYMTSPVGARGHFQFMPATAKEYGIAGKEDDLEASAAAAARYLSTLMRKYGGDLQTALAAYNWGQGNVDRKGLANAPWETRDYVQTITGRPITIEQKTEIHIASSDPAQAGREVRRNLEHVNSDLVRNLSGAVR